MSFLHQSVVFLHVITAAAWFGMSLRLGAQARLAASGNAAIVEDGQQTVRLLNLFMLLTFVFSMAAFLLGGGYAGQVQYHIASTLILVLLAFQYLLIRPAWNKLTIAVTSGDSTESGSLWSRRIAVYAGVSHMIWLILLILMFWNRFTAAL